MIAYEQLYHLDISGIKGAVDAWTEFIRRYERMGQAYEDEVVANFDRAGWTSMDGTSMFARAQIAAAQKEFGDAVTEAKGLRAVLEDAHDELKAYKSELHALREEAAKDGVLISGTGQVSLKDPDPEGDKPLEIAGPLSPPGMTPNRLKVEAWEARIKVVLVKATDADISAATALKRNTGKGGKEGFNDKTVKSVDQDEAQRSAKLLEKYEKGEKLSPAELKELERVMRHNEKDPQFSRMLLNDLGPEATLRLQEDLEKERAGDGANKERYANIQNSLANSVGAANQDKQFSDKWRADMRELGTKRPDGDASGPYGYQSLTELLKHGDKGAYPPHMTTGLTDDIIAAEKKDPEIWDESQRVDPGDDAKKQEIVDPVDNMLNVMSGDPDTATRYLDPKADGGKDRLDYLLGGDKDTPGRHWPNVHVSEMTQGGGGPIGGTELDSWDEDPTNSRTGFANALEAATTGVKPGEEKIDYGPHSEGEARVMQRTIELLDQDAKGDEVHENMQRPLARALSDYTADTHDIIAGSKDAYDNDGGRKDIIGSGDNAHIANKEASVIRVLRGVSDDPENYAQIYEAERFYAAETMDRAPKEPGNNNENWNVPARDAGNVLGAYNAIGSDAYLDQRDEKKQWADDVAKARYHEYGMPITAVPYVGDAAQRMLDQTTYDWSKDVKAEADLAGKEATNDEKAKGSAGTKDLIDQWVTDRNQHGGDISSTTERDMKQEAETSYLVHRGSALAALRGEY
ncbi:hypothetical protein [Streptomyces sp. Da 82-17]|uniref:hypothetical protein n=1 Tax=Streptomyces sp. Da 82-17 TaxID=3377116 RepID=UPI0038D4920C